MQRSSPNAISQSGGWSKPHSMQKVLKPAVSAVTGSSPRRRVKFDFAVSKYAPPVIRHPSTVKPFVRSFVRSFTATRELLRPKAANRKQPVERRILFKPASLPSSASFSLNVSPHPQSSVSGRVACPRICLVNDWFASLYLTIR